MGIGISVFLIAVGAILAFGVNAATPHANLDVIGMILMGVGALGLLIAIALLGSWRRGPAVQDRVIERERVGPTI
jgi:tellurite resistance protein TehA-like permease